MDIKLITEDDVSNLRDFINFKIIIIGDVSVWKSCILKRAVQNIFDKNYNTTIGFEFLAKHFLVDKLKFKLQIWDTMGAEMYRSLFKNFYRNTSLAIIVYDITRRETYDNLGIWINELRSNLPPELPIFIAGNKKDLEKERKISVDEGKKFSLSNGAKYFTECSAKTGYKVEEIFKEVVKCLYNIRKDLGNNNNPSGKLKISMDNEGSKKKKLKCC